MTPSLWLLLIMLVAAPQTAKRLWVLEAPGEVVEVDPSSWAVKSRVKVPAEFLNDPDSLQINHDGLMLFCPDPQIQFGNPNEHYPTDKLWLWDGRSVRTLDRGPTGKQREATEKNTAVENARRWALSGNGRQLYCFENESKIAKDADGAEASVSKTFRAWETDLNGGQPSQIAAYSFAPCECGTGACSETCLEVRVWYPEEGVDDFFIASHWIPGQIEATYQASFVYRRAGAKWSSRNLPRALEDICDAARSAAMIVHRVLDGGCCGWENSSDDQTLLAAGGRDVVLFDERLRYANPNCDVSFFTSAAKISPDGSAVAVTVASTLLPDTDIRLSDEGKPNREELARIRRTAAELPAVEVLDAQNPARRFIALPRASLVGWLDAREILVLEDGTLAAVDVSSGTRRSSAIKAPKESLIFLR